MIYVDGSRFDRLSPRHRDVLRGVAALRTSKQIAAEHELGVGTVDTYIAEAVAILGVRNRRDAALMFDSYENPGKSGGQSQGVAPIVPPLAIPTSTGTRATWLGPLDPRNREADNEYGVIARIGWIIFGAVALAFGLLAVVGIAESGSNLYRSHYADRR